MREFVSKYLGTVLMGVAALGTAVALVWHGEDVATVGAILAAVGLFLDNRFRLSDQNQTLSRIDENVNGKLDLRIKEGAKAAISELILENKNDTKIEDTP